MGQFRKVGLTGGIASGKSTVAELFKAIGLTVINLDELGRTLTDSSPDVQKRLGTILGAGVYDGLKFDRLKAREALFASPEKRRQVEAYLHPLIETEFEKRAAAAQRTGENLVICEAALLMEVGLDRRLDGLVLVSAPESVRSQRVVDRDHIGAVLAQKMIRTQMRDADRDQNHSTFAIENTGSLADLTLKVSELVEVWKTRGWL